MGARSHDPDHHDDHRHAHGGHDGARRAWRKTHSHRHDAPESIDDALVASRRGMSVLGVSVIGLGATAGLQLIVLILSGSVALLADTVHNFADVLTAVPLALAFWLGRRPATARFTYGYGRAEDLAGLFVLLLVAGSAGLAAYEAVLRLVHPAALTHAGWVAAAGVIGFVGNEVVARYRIVVGRDIGSLALEADGHHARVDGLSSLGVVAAAVGTALGWARADAVFGLAISVTILSVVRSTVIALYHRMMDAVDAGLVDQAGRVVDGTPGVATVDAVRMRWIGHRLHAEVELSTDGGLTVRRAHDIAERAHHRLLHEIPKLGSATIHLGPVSTDGTDPHAATAHHVDPVFRPGPIVPC